LIFGNESISTFTRSNSAIWMALAFQAGVINIGGFMACHRFVSHVTGFSTFFGVEFSNGQFERAIGMLLVPLLFLSGAILSGYLVDTRLRLHKKPKYYIVFGVMFVLILVVVVGGFNGMFGIFGEPLNNRRDYILLALLCLICGLQNATVSTVSKSIVRTTHLTGITTDLGIGIARVLNRHRIKGSVEEDMKANLMRVGIIFFFGAGSVVGGFLFAEAGYRGFLLPVAISGFLFGITFYFQVIRENRITASARI
jgi:uncharacterized membrane protein YoaK (UPF0700 family)